MALRLCATLTFMMTALASSAHAGGREASLQEFRDQITKAPTVEAPKDFAPEDMLDQVVGKVVEADVAGTPAPEEDYERLITYFVTLNPYLERFVQKKARGESLIRPDPQTADIWMALQETQTRAWVRTFWLYTAIHMKLQPHSKWRNHVQFMIEKSYAQLAFNINEMKQPGDVKVAIFTDILARSPALEDGSDKRLGRRFSTLIHDLEQIDHDKLGEHNYEARNKALDAYPIPASFFQFIRPHLKHGGIGATIAATGLLPFLQPVGIIPTGVAILYFHFKFKKLEEDRQKLKDERTKAVDATKSSEKQAFGYAQKARERAMQRCGIVFGEDPK